MVYYSFTYSHFTYCISSWGGEYQYLFCYFWKNYKKAVKRITFNNTKTSTKPFFSKLLLPKLNNIYKIEIAKLMHKAFNKPFGKFNDEKLIVLDQIYVHNTKKSNKKTFI